ncbi:MAG TPA: hypothetical protein VF408_08870 [Sediminibacterium sp.]
MEIFKIKVSGGYLLNLVTTFLSQACSAGLIIILTPVLQRKFSVDAFSNYGVLLNIILVASAFDFGFNTGLLRRLIHEPVKASVLVSSTFFLYWILFLVSIPVFFFLYSRNLLRTGDGFIANALLTSLLVVQTMVAMLFDIILQTTNRIFLGKLIRIGKVILECVVLLACSSYNSPALLLLASGAVNCLYILTLFSFSRRHVVYRVSLKLFSWQALADHARYSSWYFLNAIGMVLAFNSQIILLNSVVSKADVAKYILVSRFLDVVRLGATNFTTILFPSLALAQSRGEWAGLRKMYFMVLARVIILSLLILLFLLTAGRWIFRLWSGQADGQIQELYTFLSVFTILIVIDNVSSVFLHAFRLNRLQTIISLGQGILALFIGSLLLTRLGIAGMAIGSITALLLTNFIYNPAYLVSQFRKHVKSPPSHTQ